MDYVGRYFNLIIDGMKQEFVIYGYAISWWQVMIFGIVASIIAYLIGGFISGD